VANDRTPSYRLHRASGNGVVTLNGKDHYLGKHGTAESRRAYDRIIAEWIARGRVPGADGEPGMVKTLVIEYIRHASTYYVKAGEPTPRVTTIKNVCREMIESFGNEQVGAITPADFLSLRTAWIGRGLARTTINGYFGLAREVFRWGVEHGMVSPTTWEGLRAIRTLYQGRSAAKERPAIGIVTTEAVETVLPLVDRDVAAMIQLQLLTGMRPGEAASMTPAEIDRRSTPWIFKPPLHKTVHHKRVRVIALGPKARAILAPWIEAAKVDGLIFPLGVTRERTSRSRKIYPRHRAVFGYRRAIGLACRKAKIPSWSPNQLRHVAATEIRLRSGIEAARITLGHSDLGMTEVYAERDMDALRRMAEEFG
jgi:integrase